MVTDLDDYSFEEWTRFVFDYPALPGEWLRASIDWKGDATKLLTYVTTLFGSASSELRKYSKAQIQQGLWWLLGPEGGLREWIWDRNIPFEMRKECIESMISVFRDVFSKDDYGDICYMWWDLIRNFGTPEKDTEQVIFNALAQILNFETRDVQLSALHGLGHLELPGKRKAIEDYLMKRPNLDEELKAYAVTAIEGNVE